MLVLFCGVFFPPHLSPHCTWHEIRCQYCLYTRYMHSVIDGGNLEIYQMMSGLVNEYKLHLVMIQLVILSVPFQKMEFL